MSFYHPQDFRISPSGGCWTADITDAWKCIRLEFSEIQSERLVDFTPEQMYKPGYECFPLYEGGSPIHDNCECAPCTAALVGEVPGITAAHFEVINPASHIIPEWPPEDERMMHFVLGLITPMNCVTRLGDTMCPLIQGGCFIYDSESRGEAWNLSEKITCAVLTIDFVQYGAWPSPISD